METKRTAPKMTDLLTMRMLGDNITLYRSAWRELLDELRPESYTAGRVRELLERAS